MILTALARKRYCPRMVEILNSLDGKWEHTVTAMFDTNEVAIFIFQGEEEECNKLKTLVRGEFLTMDVVTLPIVWSKSPLID